MKYFLFLTIAHFYFAVILPNRFLNAFKSEAVPTVVRLVRDELVVWGIGVSGVGISYAQGNKGVFCLFSIYT